MHSRFARATNRACRLAGMIALIALLSACDKPKVENISPELTLTNLNGTKTSLHAYRGKLLVLNVWASWCPPCRREMPSLERLSKSANSAHIVVAGIATDESVNAVREFVAQQGVTFDIFIDTPGNVAKVLGVQVYPETLLIAPDGKIVERIAGEREWDSPEMLKVLEEAYQGRIRTSDIPPVLPPPRDK